MNKDRVIDALNCILSDAGFCTMILDYNAGQNVSWVMQEMECHIEEYLLKNKQFEQWIYIK